MALYDEEEVVKKIEALPKDVKLHLSHIVRNGICNVSAAVVLDEDIAVALGRFMTKWEDLGL
jgi:hypothetical protein